MKHMLTAIVVVGTAATALIALPADRTSAAPKPTPTPTPVALQYDELSRMVMATATPPPPGSFQEDYKLAMTAPPETAMQTPAPRRRGIGNILNAAMNPVGAAVDVAAENAGEKMAENMMGPATASMRMLGMLRDGHVVRYTYYWSKSWIREEDPLAQTATISKCQQHQFITLDLAKKTYHISDTTPKGCDTMPQQQGGSHAAPTVHTEPPGTVDMTVSASGKNLGPKRLEGINTTGSSNQFQMAMTNATGSCHNGAMLMTMTTYVSGIRKPRAYCPLVTPKYVASEPGDITRGGCKPTFKTSMSGNPMSRSSDFLEMYVLTSMSGGETMQQAQANAGKFNQLLERGNVAFLLKEQADPLFEVPAGFTEQK